MIYLNNLYVTHNELRNLESLKNHINQYNINGIISTDKKIKIANFGDKQFVRDGHHFATFLYHISNENNPVISPRFYDVEYYEYHEFLDINLDVGWCTPFDVNQHVRKCELGDFRKTVEQIYITNGRLAAENFIRTNTHLYLEDRQILTVRDMYEKYKENL